MNGKTRIIMIRHGQSEANASHRFAGHSNFDLTDLGKKQAELAAEYLYKREKLDAVYSSDLLRAHNTALPFSRLYGLPVNDRKSLRELYAGAWEGMVFDDINEKYPEDFRVWREDFSNARCTGGESVAELYQRIVPAVKEIAEENIGKTILIATHATPIRAIEAYANGFGADEMGKVSFVKNASLNVFEYSRSDGKIIPLETNSVRHLVDCEITDVPKDIKA